MTPSQRLMTAIEAIMEEEELITRFHVDEKRDLELGALSVEIPSGLEIQFEFLCETPTSSPLVQTTTRWFGFSLDEKFSFDSETSKRAKNPELWMLSGVIHSLVSIASDLTKACNDGRVPSRHVAKMEDHVNCLTAFALAVTMKSGLV